MACLRPPDENLSLKSAELAFASLAFRLAWSRIACEFVERRDLTDAARDHLARAVLSNIKQPLGEPEVVASRALRPFREILPVAALNRDLRDEAPDPDLNVRACRETAVLVRQSRTLIDGIIARQRETRTIIEGAFTLVAEQRRQI